jgi:hypothetical protein
MSSLYFMLDVFCLFCGLESYEQNTVRNLFRSKIGTVLEYIKYWYRALHLHHTSSLKYNDDISLLMQYF